MPPAALEEEQVQLRLRFAGLLVVARVKALALQSCTQPHSTRSRRATRIEEEERASKENERRRDRGPSQLAKAVALLTLLPMWDADALH